MRSHLISLALTASLGCVGFGCSSTSTDNNAANDSGTTGETTAPTDSDTTIDSATTADGGGDTLVVNCVADLPSGYKCADFPPGAPKTTCTEALLQEFLTKCITADSKLPADCTAWKSANTACNACIEDWSFDMDKVLVDDYKCFEKLSPGCGKAMNCGDDCLATVCGDCEMGDEQDQCTADQSKSGGRCFDVATSKIDTCRKDPKNAPCTISQYYTSMPDLAKLRGEMAVVLRGACRDNGDWTNSSSAGGDAGTSETGSDDAASDGGAAIDAASGG